MKASSFNELCIKTATSFSVNPNTILLRFEEPSGDKLTLDSEDTYEYMEQLLEDYKSHKSEWKLIITLSCQAESIVAQPPANSENGSRESESQSDKSILVGTS